MKQQPRSIKEKKDANLDNDVSNEMEHDGVIDNTVQDNDNDEQDLLLNLSLGSDDTVLIEDSRVTKKPLKKAVEYFIFNNATGKYKCTVCEQVKSFPYFLV